MRESLVKTEKSNIKDVLLLSGGLTAEEKLQLAQSLLPFMSNGLTQKPEAKMASSPDREVLSARMCLNLVFTRVSAVFRSSTSFPYTLR